MGNRSDNREIKDQVRHKRRRESWPASIETGVPGTGPVPADELPEGVEADLQRAENEKREKPRKPQKS